MCLHHSIALHSWQNSKRFSVLLGLMDQILFFKENAMRFVRLCTFRLLMDQKFPKYFCMLLIKQGDTKNFGCNNEDWCKGRDNKDLLNHQHPVPLVEIEKSSRKIRQSLSAISSKDFLLQWRSSKARCFSCSRSFFIRVLSNRMQATIINPITLSIASLILIVPFL